MPFRVNRTVTVHLRAAVNHSLAHPAPPRQRPATNIADVRYPRYINPPWEGRIGHEMANGRLCQHRIELTGSPTLPSSHFPIIMHTNTQVIDLRMRLC